MERGLVAEKQRETTDSTCLILFIAYTLLLLLVTVFCAIQGSTQHMQLPHDADGQACGLDLPQHPYLYFPSPQYDSLWLTVCVAACPSQSDTAVDCSPNSAAPSCLENNSVDNSKAFHVYATSVFRGSVCLPDEDGVREKILPALAALPVEEALGSALRDWPLLLLMVPIVAGMALLAVVLIRLVAGYVIYLLYLLVALGFLGFAVYLVVPTDTGEGQFLLKRSQPVAIICSVLSFLLSFMVLFLFCSSRERIRTSVSYIAQANDFLSNNYRLLVILPLLLGGLLLLVVFWLFMAQSFFSMADSSPSPHSLPFQHYRLPPPVLALLAASLAYLLWGLCFLMHIANYLVAATLANWQLKRPSPYSAASKGFLFAHAGTVCAGSALTALLGWFKFEVEETDCGEKTEEERAGCCGYVRRCYGCFCCCCIATVFRCFHHAAYAMVALTGCDYCVASKEVAALLQAEKHKWNVVSFLYLIFDQLLPAAFAIAATLIANALVSAIPAFDNATSSRLLLFLIVAATAYAIAHFFISLYSQSVQALFVLTEFHARLPDKAALPLRYSDIAEPFPSPPLEQPSPQ